MKVWSDSLYIAGWAPDPGVGLEGQRTILRAAARRLPGNKKGRHGSAARAAGIAPAVALRSQWTSRRLLVCGVRFCSVSVSTPSSKRASAPASVTSTGSSNVRA